MDVSVIVPLYNGKKYIKHIIWMIEQNCEKLKSGGNEKQIEIIFVNDNPKEVITEKDIYKSKKVNNTVLLTNEHNCGIHKTRINGLQCAKGEYILFLDQDDEITNSYFFTQFQHIWDADAVLCNGIYRNNKRIYKDELHQREAITKDKYLSQETVIISPGQVLMRKDKIPQEWKMISLRKNGSDDVFMWVLMLVEQKTFMINPECEYYHNEDGSNTSLNFVAMKESVEELLAVIKENDILEKYDLKIFTTSILKRIEKYSQYIYLLNNWEKIVFNIKSYIENAKCKTVAIYGYGVIGRKIYGDMKDEGMEVDCFIDRDAEAYAETEIKVYSLKDVKQVIDLLIITPLFDIDRIKEKLSEQKSIGKQMSLKDFLEHNY